MKSEAEAVLEQLEAVEQLVERVKRAGQSRLVTQTGDEELSWLEAAERRLSSAASALRATVEASLALPELKALRAERVLRLEQDWLRALRTLLDDLVRCVGATSPLIEALFPHQRFDRVERPGAAQRAYRAEFGVRSSSGYVQRMLLDPEYTFLAELLAPVTQAQRALAEFEERTQVDHDTAAELRAGVVAAGQDLQRVQRQARALAEAALIDDALAFAELGFDAPKRRVSRAASPLETQ
ncbi:MAG: hypothetical protein QM756_06335 [Polyangiaceae bacterium]